MFPAGSNRGPRQGIKRLIEQTLTTIGAQSSLALLRKLLGIDANGRIRLVATVAAGRIPPGTLTVKFDEAKLPLVSGGETVPLGSGTYEKTFEWHFHPIVSGTAVEIRLEAKAGSLVQVSSPQLTVGAAS